MNPALSPEQQQLLLSLNLPIRGRSWPKPIALMAWAVIALIGLRLGFIATHYGDQVATSIIACVVLAFCGMIVVAYFMLVGQTTITTAGIQQEWILKRELLWQDLKFAKFVPLFFSKRLICFTKRGRPIVFQGASPELQVAFAQIALAHRRPI